MANDAKTQAAAAQTTASSAQTTVSSQSTTVGQLATFAQQYGSTAAAADVIHAGFDTRIAGLESRKWAVAATPVTLLAVNGTVTVTLTWSRPMPSTTYNVDLAHSAVLDLTKVAYTVTAKTTTSITVKVQSVGIALAASTLTGLAWGA